MKIKKILLNITKKNVFITVVLTCVGIIAGLALEFFYSMSLIVGILVAGLIFWGLLIFARWHENENIKRSIICKLKPLIIDIVKQSTLRAIQQRDDQERMFLVELDDLRKAEQNAKIDGCKIIGVDIVETNIEYDPENDFLHIEADNIRNGLKYTHYIPHSPNYIRYLNQLKQQCPNKDIFYAILSNEEISNVMFSEDSEIVLYHVEKELHNEDEFGNHIIRLKHETIGYMNCPGIVDEDSKNSYYHVRLSKDMTEEIQRRLEKYKDKVIKIGG